jgi:hypothetical protein
VGSTHCRVRAISCALYLLCLAVLREHTGLPHCVVLDEAHYFLGKDQSENGLLNVELDFCLL